MKRLLLFSVIVSLVGLPLVTAAQNPPGSGWASSFSDMFNNVIAEVWLIFVALAIVLFIYAGVLFLTASGNPERITKAKSAFLWGIAGVAVAIIAFTIIQLVGNLLGAY